MRSVLTMICLAGSLSFACVAASDAEGGGESTEQDLTASQVEALAVISPPEVRVVTSGLTSLLGPAVAAGRRVSAIRRFALNGKQARLVIDVDSLASSVVAEEALVATSRASTGADDVASAPYPNSLAALSKGDALLSLDSEAPSSGADEPFALTVDMCQSKKPFEKRLFDWAATLADALRRPVPVGIAMTGGWAKAHEGELEDILGFERRGKIAITWINHSSTHPLHCLDAACRKAEFLTASSVDFDEEVLGLERSLLGRGLVPSPIFRFPGLVHNAARMRQLQRLSLMPIDADAWIAKGQGIKPRAVVLVHGNGNEPEGITGFLKAVESPGRAAALRSGKSAVLSPLLIAPTPPR